MSQDNISRNEIRKDAIQDGFEATVSTVGQVGGLLVGAVRDVGRAVGGLATELFEIRDAARKAGQEQHSDD
ncbi:hypothetical protein ASG90_02390 [Nocardioides sp. Soil797]|nr:hypothetical protein ASG90_02390 [Nocardioides sp. Soil797]